MDHFELKYDVIEDEKTRDFHRGRRMFCIYKDKLFVAEPNLPYSHAIWFEKKGWISKEEDKLMDEIIRGIVDNRGDTYFYFGYDFNINDEIESIFFRHLDELVEQLKLKLTAEIYGGLVKQRKGEWPPRKKYGKIRDYL